LQQGQAKPGTNIGDGRVRFVIHPDKPVTLPQKDDNKGKEKKP
jgi:hypothetical protein